MKLYRMPLGPIGTNCYIVVHEPTKEAFIIDPGDEGEHVCSFLAKEGIQPKAILLTHGHADHIGGIPALVKAYNLPVYISAGDEPFLYDAKLNLSGYIGGGFTVTADVKRLSEGDVLTLTEGGPSFTVLETPGHTPGGVCFYGEGQLFAGDTLFLESVGRTDFPGGSFETLSKHIKEKLFVLPGETVVYPGHGEATTIAHELEYNPFVR